MTFRDTFGTATFPGSVLREGLHEGFVEIFAEQSETSGILGVDDDTTPPELAESSTDVSHTDAFSVTITLSFFDT
jgi:hypothetical protein